MVHHPQLLLQCDIIRDSGEIVVAIGPQADMVMKKADVH